MTAALALTLAGTLLSVATAQTWTPAYTLVVIGNPDTVGDEGASQCAQASELHELRCCSNHERDGYIQNEDCSVWAASALATVGVGIDGCVDSANYADARATCAADGGRLCSAAEVEGGCTSGSGCQHDHDLVRTSTPCTPDSADGASRPETDWIPAYSIVVRGNPANAGIDGEVSPACVASSELHELRCCSDTEISGYQQVGACEVWAESQFLSVGEGGDGCVEGADYAEAQAVCYADGARMCTSDELVRGCTARSGCGHDEDLVRSADSCPPPPGAPTLGNQYSHFSWVTKGNPSLLGMVGEPDSLCVGKGELHEVRCCSDVELPGYTKRLAGDSFGSGGAIDGIETFQQVDCDVWGESQFASIGDGAAGCVDGGTYAEARDICAADGARLCTKAEVDRGCTSQTGCMHDFDLIRTSDPCTPEYAWVIIGSSGMVADEGGAACARTSEMNEVRCCSHDEIDGYEQRHGCSVWAESQFSSGLFGTATGCVDGADFAHATDICKNDGARLCTISELTNDCTRGSGCGHDADLIWTQTSCDPSEGMLGIRCQTQGDFDRFTGMVNAQCCSQGACESSDDGLPTDCDSACAEVVLPMQSACTAPDPYPGAGVAGFLSDPSYAAMAADLDTVVQICSRGGGGH